MTTQVLLEVARSCTDMAERLVRELADEQRATVAKFQAKAADKSTSKLQRRALLQIVQNRPPLQERLALARQALDSARAMVRSVNGLL